MPQVLGKLPVDEPADGLFGVAADVGGSGFLREGVQANTGKRQKEK